MADTKKIIINTSDFQVAGGPKRTRKRSTEGSGSTPELRVRQPIRSRNGGGTARNNNTLLKFIRKHQEEKRRQLMDDPPLDEATFFGESVGSLPSSAESFDQTLAYFDRMQETASQGVPAHSAPSFVTNENVSMNFPPVIGGGSNTLPSPYNMMATEYAPPPLPSMMQPHAPQPAFYQDAISSQPLHQEGGPDLPQDEIVKEDEETGEKVRLKYVKQKKTRHRKYKVGKSQDYRKVGVLVSNRTIRKGITTKSQLMKQTPIHEIRAFLVKRGLIKVGTPAPNEVLRKMYETSQLMCGELYNHNTDILLHNFMTGDEE
jgi:hypothetical protein